MKIIVCLAGLSSRFTREGFTRPKYELPLADTTVLEHTLLGFRSMEPRRVALVALSTNRLRNFINSRPQLLELSESNALEIVELPEVTSGQAETVLRALDLHDHRPDEPFVVFNGDTVYRDWSFPADPTVASADGFLDVTLERGDHWSFACVDDPSDPASPVVRTAEKERISDLCSTGLYYFASAATFRDAYATTYSDADTSTPIETYIAPMYNALIRRGADVRVNMIDRADIRFLGTPDEYRSVVDASGRDPADWLRSQSRR